MVPAVKKEGFPNESAGRFWILFDGLADLGEGDVTELVEGSVTIC